MSELLAVHNLSKRFGGLRAVQDLSFSVKEGQTLAVIGPNGAGKTTCFNLITGYIRPDKGSVIAAGRELTGLLPHRVCIEGVARTFQVARPFGKMSVLANVMVGALVRGKNLNSARRRARDAIAVAGLGAQEGRLACDLNTIDQRRLELARALATEPRILLLDEVMAGLNKAEIDQAISLVRDLSRRGLTIVIVEHVMRAVMAVAEHIVVLDHGQKIAEGSPKDVVANEEVVRAYLGSGYVHVAAPGESGC
jgi:branched-chain amino acid transport system ATP-binding protein